MPTASLLVLLRLAFLESERISQDVFENLAHIGRALDTDPFFNDRIADRMEDYKDLAQTTIRLTTIAQQVAQVKSNLEGHQEITTAVRKMHEEYCQSLQDPVSTNIAENLTEIGERLQCLSTDIRENQRRVDVQDAIAQAQIQTVRSRTVVCFRAQQLTCQGIQFGWQSRQSTQL